MSHFLIALSIPTIAIVGRVITLRQSNIGRRHIKTITKYEVKRLRVAIAKFEEWSEKYMGSNREISNIAIKIYFAFLVHQYYFRRI